MNASHLIRAFVVEGVTMVTRTQSADGRHLDAVEGISDSPQLRTRKKTERRKFPPKFVNHLDKVVVFDHLKQEELAKALEIELSNVQKHLLGTTTRPFLFRITEGGRAFLLQEGTDQRYGARRLKQAIERHVVYPITRLLAAAQVHQGDALLIDRHPGYQALAFTRLGKMACESKHFRGRALRSTDAARVGNERRSKS